MTQIRQSEYNIEFEEEPQAIFARAIKFFTLRIFSEEDDLDTFECASFNINNKHHFSLRHYKNDPDKITSLYAERMSQEDAVNLVALACTAFGVSQSILHWRKGMEFSYGKLRPIEHELKEQEARDIVLKIACEFPGRKASTAQIKDKVPELVSLSAGDMVPYRSRISEPRWRQRIGNVISHAPSGTSIFTLGYALKTASEEIQVTDQGVDYLKSIGFSADGLDL